MGAPSSFVGDYKGASLSLMGTFDSLIRPSVVGYRLSLSRPQPCCPPTLRPSQPEAFTVSGELLLDARLFQLTRVGELTHRVQGTLLQSHVEAVGSS